MPKLNLGRVVGDKGEKGDSVKTVTKKSGTGAAGTTDTYNVNLDTGTVAGTFTVYNGKDGAKGDKGEPGPTGATGDTGSQGPKGDKGDSISGVALTSGNHSPGTTDKYTVELDNGESAGQFTVYNGKDGKTGAVGPAGPQGPKGLDATVNGYNALTMEGGGNIQFSQVENKITISMKIWADFDEDGKFCIYEEDEA